MKQIEIRGSRHEKDVVRLNHETSIGYELTTHLLVNAQNGHPIAPMEMRMGNETLRTIGFVRTKFWIGMRNLCYNMSQLVSQNKLKKSK